MHNSPVTNGDAAHAWRRSFTKLVSCVAPSRCATFAVANPVAAARKGNSHDCLYLVRRQGGKLRQLFVPRQWEGRIREAAKNHQKMEQLVEQLSELEWKRLKKRKK